MKNLNWLGFWLVGIKKYKKFLPTIFFFFFWVLNFALNTLSLFLLYFQNSFWVILSWHVEEHVKQNSSLNFVSLVGFQASKVWVFFLGKFTAEQVLKSLSGRNNSLKPPVFGFCNRLPYGLYVWKNQESWEFWLSGLG